MARKAGSWFINFDLVQEALDRRFLSVTRFAFEIGMAPNTLYQLKNGRRKASMATVWKIAKALNMEPGAIVKKGE